MDLLAKRSNKYRNKLLIQSLKKTKIKTKDSLFVYKSLKESIPFF